MDMQTGESSPSTAESRDLKTLLEEFERGLIVEALKDHGGNQRRSAFALGLLPTTLHEKMKRLGLIGRPPHLLRPAGPVATASGKPGPGF